MLTLDHPSLLKVRSLYCNLTGLLADVHQVFGLCLERKPWLLIVEYMEYKDLAGVIRNIKKLSLPVRINELLVFPVQIAAGGAYLAEVRVAFYL